MGYSDEYDYSDYVDYSDFMYDMRMNHERDDAYDADEEDVINTIHNIVQENPSASDNDVFRLIEVDERIPDDMRDFAADYWDHY